jgi:hypothetical protein
LKNGQYGVINRKGEWIVPPQYKSLFLSWNNYYIDAYAEEYGKAMTLLDTNGKIVIPPLYNHIRLINENLFEVEVSSSQGNYNKHGIIDRKGRMIIPPLYRRLQTNHYNQNKIVVTDTLNDLWGSIDTLNNPLIPCKFGSYIDYRIEEETYALTTFNGQNVIINQQGNIMFNPPGNQGHQDYWFSYSHGVFVLGKWISHHHYNENICFAYSRSGNLLLEESGYHQRINVSKQGILMYNKKRFEFNMALMDTLGNKLDTINWDGIAFAPGKNLDLIIICKDCEQQKDEKGFISYKKGKIAVVYSLDTVLVPGIFQRGWKALLFLLMTHREYSYRDMELITPFNVPAKWIRRKLDRMKKVPLRKFLDN